MRVPAIVHPGSPDVEHCKHLCGYEVHANKVCSDNTDLHDMSLELSPVTRGLAAGGGRSNVRAFWEHIKAGAAERLSVAAPICAFLAELCWC